jgi:hypothetical protein
MRRVNKDSRDAIVNKLRVLPLCPYRCLASRPFRGSRGIISRRCSTRSNPSNGVRLKCGMPKTLTGRRTCCLRLKTWPRSRWHVAAAALLIVPPNTRGRPSEAMTIVHVLYMYKVRVHVPFHVTQTFRRSYSYHPVDLSATQPPLEKARCSHLHPRNGPSAIGRRSPRYHFSTALCDLGMLPIQPVGIPWP